MAQKRNNEWLKNEEKLHHTVINELEPKIKRFKIDDNVNITNIEETEADLCVEYISNYPRGDAVEFGDKEEQQTCENTIIIPRELLKPNEIIPQSMMNSIVAEYRNKNLYALVPYYGGNNFLSSNRINTYNDQTEIVEAKSEDDDENFNYDLDNNIFCNYNEIEM